MKADSYEKATVRRSTAQPARMVRVQPAAREAIDTVTPVVSFRIDETSKRGPL